MEKLLTLGIDPLAIVVYLANTGLVLFVLLKLIYKPVFKIIDERRTIIINSMEEAKQLQVQFEKKLQEAEQKTKKVEVELKEELTNLHKYTEEKRSELIAEMDQARNDMLQKAQEEIERRKADLIKEAENDIKKIMARVILDIVENKVPENVIEESIHSSWKQFAH